MRGTKNVSISIIKVMETKIEVNPEKLENWLVENPEKVYRRSVASSEVILEKPLSLDLSIFDPRRILDNQALSENGLV